MDTVSHPPARAPFFRALLAPVLGCLALLALPLPAFAGAKSLEYQVKAGFLFNFAKFVEWPGAALPPGTPLRIGLVASDEVCAVIEQSLAGKLVGDRPLQVERLPAARLTDGSPLPHMLFVHPDSPRLKEETGLTHEELIAQLGTRPVLLVGESAGFAPAGGMIGFVQRGETLRFQVNLASAQRAGLKLSARLSGLAEIVNPAAR